MGTDIAKITDEHAQLCVESTGERDIARELLNNREKAFTPLELSKMVGRKMNTTRTICHSLLSKGIVTKVAGRYYLTRGDDLAEQVRQEVEDWDSENSESKPPLNKMTEEEVEEELMELEEVIEEIDDS